MKFARNLVLALASLVLLYGGAYWFFARNRSFEIAESDPYHLFDPGKPRELLFLPAAELDLRMTFDRPARKAFAGRWASNVPGEFVTISENGACAFRLGSLDYSGDLVFRRGDVSYQALVGHQGLTYLFHLRFGISGSPTVSILYYEAEVPPGHEPLKDLERTLTPERPVRMTEKGDR